MVEDIRQRAAGEVDVRYVGRIVKAGGPPAPAWMRERTRPLRIGLSVGHRAITAGTLGGFLRRAADDAGADATYLLSNNHVFADENRAQVGDPILQPGTYDGGALTDDQVASLTSFVPLETHGINTVDCAMARVDNGIGLEATCLGDDGVLAGTTDLLESGDDRVTKTGRTTGLTAGRITALELDNVVVGYETGNLRFDDQVEIESAGDVPFSEGGDSGSLIVTEFGHLAAALLFAGSDQGGRGDLGRWPASNRPAPSRRRSPDCWRRRPS